MRKLFLFLAALAFMPAAYASDEGEPAPVHPVPTPRQLLWHETEFYAFFSL